MIRRIFGAAALLTALSFAGSVTPAHAQLGWTFVGVGEFDTDDVVLALAGVSVSPRREGWSWVAGVSGYWLQYPSGVADNTTSVTSVTPSVGVKNNFGTGSAQARVGYSFRDREEGGNTSVPAFAAGAGEGFATAAQVDYWGSGSWSAQAIGSYNFGSESIWARGRLAKRLFSVGSAGSVSLGAEAAWLDEGPLDDDAPLGSESYSATKIGGLVMFNPGRGTQLNAAVGQKMGSGSASDATYFTFELVLYPR